MRKRGSLVVGIITLSLAVLASVAPAGASAPAGSAQTDYVKANRAAAIAYLRTHGYFPLRGEETLRRAKAHAAAVVAARKGTPAVPSGPLGTDPIIGASWQGVGDALVSPPDPNGAIGPNSYVETINQKIAIYTRTGSLVASATMNQLTGVIGGFLADPMVLWDPHTQRFYYNVWDVNTATMAWGFSKDNNPRTIPGDWCGYVSEFGYAGTDLPDYPKLGQTKEFLLIGVNYYPDFGSLHATRTDLLWINKPKRKEPVTTCPPDTVFRTGVFSDLRNEDDTIAFTPTPSIQTDPSHIGYVMAASDIECPDICGTGTLLTVFIIRPRGGDPRMPELLGPQSIEVGAFESPPDAPQQGTTDLLDTLDGRLTHVVSGMNPDVGRTTVWLAHSVLGGAGAQIRWYEVSPTPKADPSVVQSGVVTHPSLYIFNPGISNDRTVNLSGRAHGNSMVLGFTTSGSNAFPAVQMVSKVRGNPQSAIVLVHQSATFDNDFTCNPVCRWGDYGGAHPDPAAPLADPRGKVWLSQQFTDGTAETWNWEVTP